MAGPDMMAGYVKDRHLWRRRADKLDRILFTIPTKPTP